MAAIRARRGSALSARETLVGLWMLRLGAGVNRLHPRPGARYEILQAIHDYFDNETTEHQPVKAMMRWVQAKLVAFSRTAAVTRTNTQQNIARLASALGLDGVDQSLLALGVFVEENWALHDLLERLNLRERNALHHALGVALDLDPDAVARALRPEGRLRRSGLVTLENPGQYSGEMIAVLPLLREALNEEHASGRSLLHTLAPPASSGQLTLEDFAHLADDLQVLMPYLRSALDVGQQGVNLLFYGVPGTGKSELARAVAQALEVRLYEVACSRGSGESLKTGERLGSYQLCQRLLEGSRSLILFDEMEDVLCAEPSADPPFHTPPYNKAWMNRLLEHNPVPALSISNDVDGVDSAYLRRFDFSVRFTPLPRSVRRRVLERYLGALVTRGTLDELVTLPKLTAAQAAQAARVVAMMPAAARSTAAERVVLASRRLQGERDPLPVSARLARLDVRWLNTEPAAPQVLRALATRRHWRVCLHGPPGTGKTAFAHLLARALGVPLQVLRGSTVLSPFVGETEQAIAQAFRQASESSELLLIDEADGLFFDRAGARASWEISQVNEFLQAMESDQGRVICATNRLEAIDAAMYRRFDLIIEFRYLSQAQSVELFRRTLVRVNPRAAATRPRTDDVMRRLAALDCVTPADFDRAIGEVSLVGVLLDEHGLLALLHKYCASRTSGRHPVGFVREPLAAGYASLH